MNLNTRKKFVEKIFDSDVVDLNQCNQIFYFKFSNNYKN